MCSYTLVWVSCGVGILFKNEIARKIIDFLTFFCMFILFFLAALSFMGVIWENTTDWSIIKIPLIIFIFFTSAGAVMFILFTWCKQIKGICTNTIELKKRFNIYDLFHRPVLIILLAFTMPFADSIIALFMLPWDETTFIWHRIVKFLLYAIIWIGLYISYKKTSRIVIIKNEGK